MGRGRTAAASVVWIAMLAACGDGTGANAIACGQGPGVFRDDDGHTMPATRCAEEARDWVAVIPPFAVPRIAR